MNDVAYVQLERATGIGPVSQPWEGRILPVNYTRLSCCYTRLELVPLLRYAVKEG